MLGCNEACIIHLSWILHAKSISTSRKCAPLRASTVLKCSRTHTLSSGRSFQLLITRHQSRDVMKVWKKQLKKGKKPVCYRREKRPKRSRWSFEEMKDARATQHTFAQSFPFRQVRLCYHSTHTHTHTHLLSANPDDRGTCTCTGSHSCFFLKPQTRVRMSKWCFSTSRQLVIVLIQIS